MKLRKILATVAASAVATTAFAAAAGAEFIVPENTDAGLSVGTGMWLVQAFNVGNPEEGKPATDYGVDYASISQLTMIVKAAEPDYIDGGIGGGLVFSCNGGEIENGTDAYNKYNWPGFEYWGITDEDLDIDTNSEAGKPALFEKRGEYTYAYTNPALDNPLANGFSSIGCMQVGMQYWGSDMSDYEVVGCELKDAAGNIVLAFDGLGNVTAKAGGAAAPVVDEAPAAGDVAAATDSSKGSPDTGVADVAAVAGLALVAGAAIVVAKKRK